MLTYGKKAMWQGHQSRPRAHGPHQPCGPRWPVPTSQWQEEQRSGSWKRSGLTHWQDVSQCWTIGFPTIQGVQRGLEAPCVARGAVWGSPSFGHGYEDPPWHLAQSRHLGVSPLDAEPETGIQRHVMHCGNALRRNQQWREGRRGAQERWGLG